MNERWLEILLAPSRDGITVAETCRRYGVSRQTFYEYRRRLHREGVAALQPRSSPAKTPDEVEALIVRLRIDNPRWGARTLHPKLVQAGLKNPPVVSTVHRALKRHGLVNTASARNRSSGNDSNGSLRMICGRSTAPTSPQRRFESLDRRSDR